MTFVLRLIKNQADCVLLIYFDQDIKRLSIKSDETTDSDLTEQVSCRLTLKCFAY